MRIIESIQSTLDESIKDSDFRELRSLVQAKRGKEIYELVTSLEKKSGDAKEFDEKVLSYVASAVRLDAFEIKRFFTFVERDLKTSMFADKVRHLGQLYGTIKTLRRKSGDGLRSFVSTYGDLVAEVVAHLTSGSGMTPSMVVLIDDEVYDAMTSMTGDLGRDPSNQGMGERDLRVSGSAAFLSDDIAIRDALQRGFSRMTKRSDDGAPAKTFAKTLLPAFKRIVDGRAFENPRVETALTTAQRIKIRNDVNAAILSAYGI